MLYGTCGKQRSWQHSRRGAAPQPPGRAPGREVDRSFITFTGATPLECLLFSSHSVELVTEGLDKCFPDGVNHGITS